MPLSSIAPWIPAGTSIVVMLIGVGVMKNKVSNAEKKADKAEAKAEKAIADLAKLKEERLPTLEDKLRRWLYLEDGRTIYMARSDCTSARSGCTMEVCKRLDSLQETVATYQSEQGKKWEVISNFVGRVERALEDGSLRTTKHGGD